MLGTLTINTKFFQRKRCQLRAVAVAAAFAVMLLGVGPVRPQDVLAETIEMHSAINRTDVPKQRVHILDKSLKTITELNTIINSTIYIRQIEGTDYFHAKVYSGEEAFYKLNNDYTFKLLTRDKVPVDVVSKLSQNMGDISIKYKNESVSTGIVEIRSDVKLLASIPFSAKKHSLYCYLFNKGKSAVVYGSSDCSGGDFDDTPRNDTNLYLVKDLSKPSVQALPGFVPDSFQAAITGDPQSSVFYAPNIDPKTKDCYIARVDAATDSIKMKYAKVPDAYYLSKFGYLAEPNLVVYQGSSDSADRKNTVYPVLLIDGTTGATRFSIPQDRDEELSRSFQFVKTPKAGLLVLLGKTYDVSTGKLRSKIPRYGRCVTYAPDGTLYVAVEPKQSKELSWLQFQHIDLATGKVLAEVELKGPWDKQEMISVNLYGARQMFFWKDKLVVLSATEVRFMDHTHRF